jgi:hypothetical protein
MQPMRHAQFGDESNADHIFVVPEADCFFEMLRQPGGGNKLRVHFKGRSVIIPPGTAVQFICLAAVSANGGYAYKEDNPHIAVASITDLPQGKPS